MAETNGLYRSILFLLETISEDKDRSNYKRTFEKKENRLIQRKLTKPTVYDHLHYFLLRLFIFACYSFIRKHIQHETSMRSTPAFINKLNKLIIATSCFRSREKKGKDCLNRPGKVYLKTTVLLQTHFLAVSW